MFLLCLYNDPLEVNIIPFDFRKGQELLYITKNDNISNYPIKLNVNYLHWITRLQNITNTI